MPPFLPILPSVFHPMDRFILFLIATVISAVSGGRDLTGDVLRLPSEGGSRFFQVPASEEGTRWAILIAGSNGYWNYRHQVLHPPRLLFLFWLLFHLISSLYTYFPFSLRKGNSFLFIVAIIKFLLLRVWFIYVFVYLFSVCWEIELLLILVLLFHTSFPANWFLLLCASSSVFINIFFFNFSHELSLK